MHLAELTQSGHRRPVPPHLPWPLRAWLPEYPAAARRLVARLVGGNGGTPAQAGVCADSRSLRERLGLLGGVSRAVLLAEQADSPHPASPHQLRDLPRRRGRMDSIVSMTLLGEACFSRGAGRGGGQSHPLCFGARTAAYRGAAVPRDDPPTGSAVSFSPEVRPRTSRSPRQMVSPKGTRDLLRAFTKSSHHDANL